MKLEGKLELTWVGKYEEKKYEPRILIEDKSKSYGDPNTENMLIHGDNLLALKALEKDFAGKIKCIYIDPPYNTGSRIDADGKEIGYDDNLEHSIWLNMMKPRLELLRSLLSDQGVIAIEIDDNELAYLKVLCDEIFGRKNFVSMLTIESGEVFGKKAAHINKTYVKVKDYILIYKKNIDYELSIKPLWTKTAEPFDSHYSTYIDTDSLQKTSFLTILKSSDKICKMFEQFKLKINLNNVSLLMNLDDEFSRLMTKEFADKIFQDQPLTANLGSFVDSMEANKIYKRNGKLVFKTSGGTVRYYQPFSDALHYTDDYIQEYCRSTARGDLWKNYHTDMRNIDDEGQVKFKSSKKSERLIRDLLYSLTEENDYILDSFLGSGTTMAVAHKMKRKWIGIEMGGHAYSHCKKRIDSIINGVDLSGITKRENWQGGGGYKFYELAESLLVKNDKLPIYQLNPKYTFDMVCEAICKIEGFDYQKIGEFHGKSSENRFIHITTEFVNADYIKTITKSLSEKQSLLIYSTKIQTGLVLPDNVVVKKIPKDLLKKCKFESEVK